MSERIWTPYKLKILLHHYSPARVSDYETAAKELVASGLLQWSAADSTYRPTTLGDAAVEMLLQTPIPRTVFIDTRTGKEVEWGRFTRAGKEAEWEPFIPRDAAEVPRPWGGGELDSKSPGAGSV